MRFTEAKAKLKELAGGKFHSISYEITEFAGGGFETECYLYIDSRITGKGPTWKVAFALLEKELGIKGIEEMPDVEDREVA